MRAVVLVVLVGCAATPLALEDLPCPTSGTTLTYENFGERFMGEHCNTCHATSKSGAPSGYKFTTLDLVKKHADRIFIRAAGPNTTMPPGPDDPPESERDQLAEWLACGAP